MIAVCSNAETRHFFLTLYLDPACEELPGILDRPLPCLTCFAANQSQPIASVAIAADAAVAAQMRVDVAHRSLVGRSVEDDLE